MWTYDAQAKAYYFQRSSKPIARTVESLPGQFVDLDADGEVVGVEVLDSSFVTATSPSTVTAVKAG